MHASERFATLGTSGAGEADGGDSKASLDIDCTSGPISDGTEIDSDGRSIESREGSVCAAPDVAASNTSINSFASWGAGHGTAPFLRRASRPAEVSPVDRT